MERKELRMIFNGRTFMDIGAREQGETPRAGCHGFFSRQQNGFHLFNSSGVLEAFVVHDERQGHFVVSASSTDRGPRYMQAADSLTRAWLGLDQLSHTQERNAVQSTQVLEVSPRPFNVTLPWNPSDAEEGDYATTVWAESHAEAVRTAAEEMAAAGEKQFDTDEERNDYVDELVADGGYVVDAVDDLKYQLGVVFKGELFPDGVIREIDTAALAEILAQNRSRLIVSPAQDPSLQAAGAKAAKPRSGSSLGM